MLGSPNVCEQLLAVVTCSSANGTIFVEGGKIKKIEEETKRLEKAIKKDGLKDVKPVDPDIAAKEARLEQLRDHYRLIQKQNKTIIQAGYSTPSGYFPSFNGGYFYNNGTFYPRNTGRYYNGNYHNGHYHSNGTYCPTTRRPILQINLRK